MNGLSQAQTYRTFAATRITVEAFQQFWSDLATVTRLVHTLLTENDRIELRAFTLEVRCRCDAGIRDRTLIFANGLLDELAETSVGYSYALGEPPPPWFEHYLKAELVEVASDTAVSRIEEFLMEQLTAVWLLLYFLSEPMGHPWERVRRIADEQGGYPAGACMTKMIGDVYRRARLEFVDAELNNASTSLPHVLVLSVHPSILVKELLLRPDEMKITPGAAHVLGRCYALFQLRLYVAERRSIRYVATLQALKECWHATAGLPPLNTLAAAAHIVGWLEKNFPRGGVVDGQEVILHSGQADLKISPCALGYETGVYALESGADGTRYVGNRVSQRLLVSLRHRFLNEAQSDNLSLLGLPAPVLSAALQ